MAAAVQGAVTALESAGAQVTLADPGFERPIAAFDVLWYTGAAKILDDMPADRRSLADPGLAQAAAEGQRCSALDYVAAQEVLLVLGAQDRHRDGCLPPDV